MNKINMNYESLFNKVKEDIIIEAMKCKLKNLIILGDYTEFDSVYQNILEEYKNTLIMEKDKSMNLSDKNSIQIDKDKDKYINLLNKNIIKLDNDKKDKSLRHGKKWTLDEDDKLITLCKDSSKSYSDIAKELKRSINAIIIRHIDKCSIDELKIDDSDFIKNKKNYEYKIYKIVK